MNIADSGLNLSEANCNRVLEATRTLVAVFGVASFAEQECFKTIQKLREREAAIIAENETLRAEIKGVSQRLQESIESAVINDPRNSEEPA